MSFLPASVYSHLVLDLIVLYWFGDLGGMGLLFDLTSYHVRATFIFLFIALQVSANGNVLRSEIVGSIKMRVFLSGMPELRLGLNDKVLFDNTGREYFSNIFRIVMGILCSLRWGFKWKYWFYGENTCFISVENHVRLCVPKPREDGIPQWAW